MAERDLRDRADALLHALDRARSEAVKRGVRVDVCPAAGGECPGLPAAWEGGWTIVAAPAARQRRPGNGHRARAGGATRHHDQGQPAGRRLRVLHQPRLCPSNRRRAADGHVRHVPYRATRLRKVILANSGRARVEQTTDGLPMIRRAPRGFTLLEMMIVVAIVATLATIALPSYAAYVKRSRILDAVTPPCPTPRARIEDYFLDERSYVDASGRCGFAAGQRALPTRSLSSARPPRRRSPSRQPESPPRA